MDQQQQRREELERLWHDQKSLKGWGIFSIYYQPEDPRVVVPKQSGLGWSINFAHPLAIPTIFLSLTIVTLPALLVLALAFKLGLGLWSAFIFVFVLIASIVALCFLCSYLSSRYK